MILKYNCLIFIKTITDSRGKNAQSISKRTRSINKKTQAMSAKIDFNHNIEQQIEQQHNIEQQIQLDVEHDEANETTIIENVFEFLRLLQDTDTTFNKNNRDVLNTRLIGMATPDLFVIQSKRFHAPIFIPMMKWKYSNRH